MSSPPKPRTYVGAHVSTTGGVEKAPGRAEEIGANAFALFTRNQRRWNSPPYTAEAIETFRAECLRVGIAPEHILPHAGYLINLGSPDDEVRTKAIAGLIDETRRTAQLGLRYLNFHPGTSKGELDEAATIVRIAEAAREVLSETEGVTLVLENTAGQGSSIGRTVEQLAALVEQIDGERTAVCLDTCHAFSAGFDVRTLEGWNALIGSVERQIGLDRLVGMHINDSKYEYGALRDRHEQLGEGYLGLDAFRNVMQDRRLDGVPLILETPDENRWADEIALLRRLADESAVAGGTDG